MKKVLVLFVIAFLSMAFGPNTQTVYSMAEYDGSFHQTHDASWSSFDSGSVYVAHGIGGKSYAWVTFDLQGIDLEGARDVKLWLYETENLNGKKPNKEITLHTAFVTVSEDDYQRWVTPYEPNFTWLEKGRDLNRQLLKKHWLASDNLLPELRELAQGQRYITLAITVNPGSGFAGTIGFADGSAKNDLRRPYLKIKY